MSIEMWTDPNNPLNRYPIGTEGLEHAIEKNTVLGFYCEYCSHTLPVRENSRCFGYWSFGLGRRLHSPHLRFIGGSR